jgi:spore germination cell wall hydrolase CwlJ-like protein
MAEWTFHRAHGVGRAIARLLLGGVLAFAVSAAAPANADKADSPTIREELRCLALNIYFEARGEPDRGKIAVGHVVLNRVESGRFPDTICAVVKQGGEDRRHKCQFSWWCDGRSDQPRERKAWRHSKALAQEIYWGMAADPTLGALWYHATYVAPKWRKRFAQTAVIGEHIFYSTVRTLATAAETRPNVRVD